MAKYKLLALSVQIAGKVFLKEENEIFDTEAKYLGFKSEIEAACNAGFLVAMSKKDIELHEKAENEAILKKEADAKAKTEAAAKALADAELAEKEAAEKAHKKAVEDAKALLAAEAAKDKK